MFFIVFHVPSRSDVPKTACFLLLLLVRQTCPLEERSQGHRRTTSCWASIGTNILMTSGMHEFLPTTYLRSERKLSRRAAKRDERAAHFKNDEIVAGKHSKTSQLVSPGSGCNTKTTATATAQRSRRRLPQNGGSSAWPSRDHTSHVLCRAEAPSWSSQSVSRSRPWHETSWSPVRVSQCRKVCLSEIPAIG